MNDHPHLIKLDWVVIGSWFSGVLHWITGVGSSLIANLPNLINIATFLYVVLRLYYFIKNKNDE